MIKKHLNKASNVIIFISIVLIAYSGWRIYSKVSMADENRIIKYITPNDTINVKDMIAKNSFYDYDTTSIANKEYTALYIVSSTGCSICLKQYQIYINSIDSMANAKNIYKVLAVIDTNRAKSRWFAKVNPLKIDAVSIDADSTINILTKYGTDKMERQFVLVKNNNGKVMSRIPVETGVVHGYPETIKRISSIINNNK